jgi:hypothetical protein
MGWIELFAPPRTKKPFSIELADSSSLFNRLQTSEKTPACPRFVIDHQPLPYPLKGMLTSAASDRNVHDATESRYEDAHIIANYGILTRLMFRDDRCIDQKAFDDELERRAYRHDPKRFTLWHTRRNEFSVFPDTVASALVLHLGRGWKQNDLTVPEEFAEDIGDYISFVEDAVAAAYASFGVPCPAMPPIKWSVPSK